MRLKGLCGMTFGDDLSEDNLREGVLGRDLWPLRLLISDKLFGEFFLRRSEDRRGT